MATTTKKPNSSETHHGDPTALIEKEYLSCDVKYLQFVTELLGIGDKSAVRVPFVEPGTAPHLSWILLPVHSGANAVVKLHIIASTVCTHDHILGVWLD